jgi:hypothetical protein
MNELSPVLVPIMGMMIPIVAIIAGVYSQIHAKRLKADQRMQLIARGVPLAEIDAFLKPDEDDGPRQVKDPMRSLGNARRAAVVLIAVGMGLFGFFLIFGTIALVNINRTAGWALLGCSGTGLIPLAIGIGFLFDYRMQMREMSRFGLEVGADRFDTGDVGPSGMR